jgi:hypothetical protein
VIDLERDLPIRDVDTARGAQDQSARPRFLNLLELRDVGDRFGRLKRFAIAFGEGVCVACKERIGPLDRHRRVQRFGEIVAPKSDGLFELGLQRDFVELASPAFEVDHEMDARELTFFGVRIGGGNAPAQRIDQNVAERAHQSATEFVGRQIDERRRKSIERVEPEERLRSRPVGQIGNAGRDVQQIVFGDLEQLVARERLEHLRQGLGAVTGLR